MDTTRLDKIMAWEAGEMTAEAEAEFFQELIDSGLAWKLQGMYGRAAAHLIEQGVCHAKQ
jgi:hypothetical protein